MKTRTDLLIHNALVFSHPGHPVQKDWSIAVRNGQILDIGPSKKLSQHYEGVQEIEASGCLAMPGLINAHTHAAMSCFRGLADDQPLMEWLQQSIFPAESKLNPEQVYWSTLLSCAEMIRSGTTTFADMYLFEQEVARAVDVAGVRALIGEGLFGFPSTNYGPIDKGFAYVQKMLEDWKDHPRISFAITPHAPYTCPPPLLGLAAKFARERHLPLHIHLSETQHEMEEMQRDQGCSPVELLERIGFLGPDVIAAHCVWLSNHDMDLLAEHGVRVVYNPESNMKLASGVAPVPELLARGVSVALGTDGCASNNDLDMFREMDVGAKLQKVHRLDPTALPASQTLRMATIGGAHVLGMDAITGSLEPGKLADIIILELGHPHLQPLYHLNSQLVYSARGADVRDTIVQGKILMRDREIVSFDEAEVMTHIRDIREKVLRDIGRN